MEMTILKMKSIPTTNLVEVLTITDMLLLTTRSLVYLMENSRRGVHNQPALETRTWGTGDHSIQMTTIVEQGKHRLSKNDSDKSTSAQIGNHCLYVYSIKDCIPAITICRGQFQGVCLKIFQRDAIQKRRLLKLPPPSSPCLRSKNLLCAQAEV